MAEALNLCLVDMNDGVPNEATRCFKRLLVGFSARVRLANPTLTITTRHVQPRNLGELPPPDADLIVSSGGPGSPLDGWDAPWCAGYRTFLDRVMDRAARDGDRAPAAFVVCHSFEIAVRHLGVARMAPRGRLKFAIFPAYLTEAGRQTPWLAPLGDRIFTWEHRAWQAVDLDGRRLAALGGALLATESRPGRKDKGPALLGFRFGPGLQGTQFHPEADRPGVLAWIHRPEHAADVKDAYGKSLYERMLRTLADPSRVARTYALLVPGWLTDRFNRLAAARGWAAIPPPVQNARDFDEQVPLAG